MPRQPRGSFVTKEIPAPSIILMTVRQLAEDQPALSENAIRWDIFNEDDNGLKASGAIIRRGRTGRSILLDRERYLLWLTKRL